MRISRSGAHKNRGENILVYSSDPSINIYGDKIKIFAALIHDKNSQNTYNYTVELSFEKLAKILQKINEEYLKNPSNIERKIESHTKTLLQLLIISSGLLNNKVKEETS